MLNIPIITKALKKNLSKKRFEHSLAVAELAFSLAKRHGENPEEAYKVGLLHDCAKEWSPERMKTAIRRYRISVPGYDFIVKHAPNLLHAYVGADYAARMGWIKTRNSKMAVASHTLGRKGMSLLEKIVFIADFASKDRQYGTAGKVRQMAHKDLNAAFRFAMAKKIKWNLTASKPIHPIASQVWNSYV